MRRLSLALAAAQTATTTEPWQHRVDRHRSASPATRPNGPGIRDSSEPS
jgi:hypothetical protein